MLKMTQKTIPIILCGRSMAIASAVKEGLRPEVDGRVPSFPHKRDWEHMSYITDKTRPQFSTSS